MKTIPKPASKAALLAHLRAMRQTLHDLEQGDHALVWVAIGAVGYRVNEALEPGFHAHEYAAKAVI